MAVAETAPSRSRAVSKPRFGAINLKGISFSDPQVIVRVILGLLLALNMVAAAFVFHLFGTSTEELTRQLEMLRNQMQAENARLVRSRLLAAKIDLGHNEGDKFLASYMSTRRTTFSTIIGEITAVSKEAGMKMKETNIAPLDPVEGSNDIDMMTIAVNFEGNYAQLVKLINLLDRSKRFLIIESVTASPQPKGDLVNVSIKLNTFVKDDNGGAI